MKFKEGEQISLLMKPILMRDWIVIKETKKSIVVRKTFKQRYGHKKFIGDCYYVPKKNIQNIIRKKGVKDE